MECITDREIELFSKRHELIDTLSEERGSTPEEERRIARQERDSKTTKLFSGQAEVESWRQQMGAQRWDSVTSEGAKEVRNSSCRSIRARSPSKPTSPSIPWRAPER
jgi:hypothetical protein